MSPRLARQARAYGDLGASTDGGGAQRGGNGARGWSAVQSIHGGGRLGVRAPLQGAAARCCPRRRERPGSRPVFQNIGAFQRCTRMV